MKKLLAVSLATIFISFSTFAFDFFGSRIFELKTSLPVNISNNVFSLDDILVKNLEIDLRKIADSVPNEGFIISGSTMPQFSINLNISRLRFGMDYGIDASGKLNLSKDFFDFFGYGNKLGEKIDISLDDHMDVYAYTNFRFGMRTKKCEFTVQPTVFVPIMSSSGRLGSFSFENDEDGRLVLKVLSDTSMHYLFNFQKEEFVFNFPYVMEHIGIDLGGNISFPIKDKMSLDINARFPIVPGHLNITQKRVLEYVMDSKVMDFATAELESSDTTDFLEDDLYYINRPLKTEVYFHYKPAGSLFDFCVGGGLGVYHPFVTDFYFYPEYYLSFETNLIRIFTLGLSTEYTDQIFKHQFHADINVRFVEIDIGVSLQSASFTKSFAATGFGAYIVSTIGF